jgi:hypothetical protein
MRQKQEEYDFAKVELVANVTGPSIIKSVKVADRTGTQRHSCRRCPAIRIRDASYVGSTSLARASRVTGDLPVLFNHLLQVL